VKQLASYFTHVSFSDWISIAGIFIGTVLAIVLYKLQQRLSDRQKIENRLQLEREIGKKLYDIHYNASNSKVQLYNIKLIGKGRFSKNRRSLLWGYPYHAAELYNANFDGLEFVVGIEKWSGKKYYRVGVVGYERILGVRPEGDSSFNGIIFYVKPKLLQLDKYSIAYKTFRYYSLSRDSLGDVRKPLAYKLRDGTKKFAQSLKYNLWNRWKMRGADK